MKIGFAKEIITPPMGMELGGYAVQRKCNDVHDELYCKCVVIEQNGVHYVWLAFDLLCVDASLYQVIAEQLEKRGVALQHVLASAIHTHSAPRGMIPEKGELKDINRQNLPDDEGYVPYMHSVVEQAVKAYDQAISWMESFLIKTAREDGFNVGSERHHGQRARGLLTAMQFLTDSGRNLMVYNFPCHPTVMGADNLSVSADFVADVERLLSVDMSMFINGAAGDISTRFTRKESSFRECGRLASLVAEKIRHMMSQVEFSMPTRLCWIHESITLCAKKVESEEDAKKRLERRTEEWQIAIREGKDPKTLRILKSYVEGAGTNLKFARSMKGMNQLHLPITAFTFCNLAFVSVPGELFSSLIPEEPVVFWGYSNGYYRYICDCPSYESGYYEALGAVLEKGEGERFIKEAMKILDKAKEI